MNKKSLLFKMLALVVCLSCALGANAYDFKYGSIYYNITGVNTVEVTNNGNGSYNGNVSIPSTVSNYGKTYQVTAIGESAFYSCSGLTNVTIPNSVTSIGVQAFYHCSGLTSVNIPGSVTSIGDYAFRYCSSLSSVTFNDGLQTIGKRAFEDSKLISVSIPNSVTLIDEYAFAFNRTTLTEVTIGNSTTTGNIVVGHGAFTSCQKLASLTLGNSVTAIEDNAFSYSAIESLTIPKSVTSLNGIPFVGCDSLKTIKVASGNTVYDSRNNCNAIIQKSNNTLIQGCRNTVIPGTVKTIGMGAFFNIRSLTSITIPSSVTTIEEYAFYACHGLSSIVIPKTVTSIGNQAFSYTSFMQSMVVENGNPKYDSRGNCNAIIETATNTLLNGCYFTVIPATVTAIAPAAMANCAIRSMIIPNSVVTIGDEAFAYCWYLQDLTIGNSVTSIGAQAFFDCLDLENLTCLAATPPVIADYTTFDNDWMLNLYEQATLTVSAFSLNAYETAEYWKKFTTIEGFLQGDLNSDGVVDVTDVTLLIAAVLNSTQVNRGAADMNSDGTIDVVDVTALINRVLNGGMDPYDPHSTGRWLVLFDKNGNKSWIQLWSNPDGGYFTTVSLTTATYGTGRAKFYIVDEGVAYGASQANKSMVLGSYTSNPLTAGQNCYTVPAGYTYTIGMVYNSSDKRYAVAQQGPACN